VTERDLLIDLTADIVAAYVGHNSVSATDLPHLIAETHRALTTLGGPPAAPAVEPQLPAVPVKRSITPDHLISLEDGKPYRTLKRHLTRMGLSPERYREKWGLPKDYPMTAPNYSAQRSEMAKSLGLGRKPAAAPEPTKPARRARKTT
jgi:predicted transcriptional regulator